MTSSITFPYLFTKKIGQGGYGKVYRVKSIHTNKYYACKIIPTDRSLKEINFMLKLKEEPYIIDFYECYQLNDQKIGIVMEECTGPNIFDMLQTFECPDELQYYRKEYMLQSIAAIKSCHDNGIIHKDIKHTNFIFKDNCPDSTLRLIDFGLSEYDYGTNPCKTCGTLRFMPPEGLQLIDTNHHFRYHINDHNLITKSYDIWSLGVMFYLLYTGIDVFRSTEISNVIYNIRKGIISGSLQHHKIKKRKEAEIIKKMLRISPKMRPSIDEVHDFFVNLH